MTIALVEGVTDVVEGYGADRVDGGDEDNVNDEFQQRDAEYA